MSKTKTKQSSLVTYAHKRNFAQTPEPNTDDPSTPAASVLHFVIHKHKASRLHYDLRLECEGVLRSWAIPRGPSLDPLENRLAVRVEDHPLRYQEFEALIPKGNYGAGPMMVWDRGTYTLYEALPRETQEQTFLRQYRKGSLKVEFKGHKVNGRFTLVKIKKSSGDDWLFIKKRDQFASTEDVLKHDRSVHSGRSMDEIARGAPGKGPSPKAKVAKTTKRVVKLPAVLLKGAQKTEIPDKIRLMKPMRMAIGDDFSNEEWLCHRVPRGMLGYAVVGESGVQVRTATGLTITSRCKEICDALESLPNGTVLTGILEFQKAKTLFCVSDVLWWDHVPLILLSVEKRLEILAHVKCVGPVSAAEGVALETVAKVGGLLWYRRRGKHYELGSSNPNWMQSEGRGRVSSTSQRPILTNPEKVFWPEEGFTKKNVYDYYAKVADVMLPHLRDRPQSLNRHPNGINGKSFYQKEVAGSVPGWMETVHVSAYAGTKTVTQLLVQNADSLLYLANMGCIEINTWLSRVPTILKPDYAVIDIDPGTLSFDYVIRAAKLIKALLDQLGATAFCKTSGGRGLHIYLPVKGDKVTFADCQKFAEMVGDYLESKLPKLTSSDRSPLTRCDKLYIDALQNRKGQTMASPYSIRPRPGAMVSTPIAWSELKSTLNPAKFTLETVPARIKKKGDLWGAIDQFGNDISKLNQTLKIILED